MKAVALHPHGPDILLQLDGSPLILGADDSYSPRPENAIYTEGAIPQTLEEAEEFAQQLLSLCQDIRQQRRGT